MPVRREYKPSDLEKRLKLLNQQLYGKQEVTGAGKLTKESTNNPKAPNTFSAQENFNVSRAASTQSDVLYLKHDLLKILIIAGLAFGAQFALYFGLMNKLIKLPL